MINNILVLNLPNGVVKDNTKKSIQKIFRSGEIPESIFESKKFGKIISLDKKGTVRQHDNVGLYTPDHDYDIIETKNNDTVYLYVVLVEQLIRSSEGNYIKRNMEYHTVSIQISIREFFDRFLVGRVNSNTFFSVLKVVPIAF